MVLLGRGLLTRYIFLLVNYCVLVLYWFCTACISIPLYYHLFISALCQCNLLLKIKENKQTEKANKHAKKKWKKFLAWKLLCDTVSHTIYPLVHTYLFANVLCTDSLVWFQGLLLNILLLPCVLGSCSFGSTYPGPSHVPTDHKCGGNGSGSIFSPGSGS